MNAVESINQSHDDIFAAALAVPARSMPRTARLGEGFAFTRITVPFEVAMRGFHELRTDPSRQLRLLRVHRASEQIALRRFIGIDETERALDLIPAGKHVGFVTDEQRLFQTDPERIWRERWSYSRYCDPDLDLEQISEQALKNANGKLPPITVKAAGPGVTIHLAQKMATAATHAGGNPVTVLYYE